MELDKETSAQLGISRFVVVGGSGFVGQHLVNDLRRRGLPVLVVDIAPFPERLEPSEYANANIRSPAALAAIGFRPDDAVIHLAANQYHTKVPRRNRAAYFYDTNLVGTQNLLLSMDRAGCRRLAFFSTDMVYGLPKNLPVSESHPTSPFGPYGASKLAAEKTCKSFASFRDFKITTFRPRMIVGPGRFGILTKLFSLIDLGLPVPMIGNGKNVYQMVSVFDCVQAIEQAILLNFPRATYNLGSANPPCVRDLLHGLAKSAKSKSILVPTHGPFVKGALSFLGRVGLELMYPEQYRIADQQYILDISKARNELGWQPQHSDEAMLEMAYQQYRESREKPCQQ